MATDCPEFFSQHFPEVRSKHHVDQEVDGRIHEQEKPC